MIQLTADIINGFTQEYLLANYDDPQPTPGLHLDLWELMTSKRQKVGVAAPRGHAKSTAVTHAYVLANVLFRVRDYVLIISDTSTQAEEFLADLKREMEENTDLIEAFGIKGFTKDNENTVIVELENGDGKRYEFRISAKGSGKSLRGLKWRHKRPNLIVCDDLENDEMVESDERREKFRRWFRNACLPCGSKRCLYRIVGTILHFDSLLNRIMPDPEAKTTVHDPLKTYSTTNHKAWLTVLYRAHDEEFENILWPEMFDKERLEGIRQEYVEDGNPEGYAQEYLNDPIAQENAYFKKENLIDFQDITQGPWEFYIGGDLAISSKDKAAFSVLAVLGVNSEGTMRVFHVERFRGDGLEILDKIFQLNEHFKPQLFFFEQENIMRTIQAFLDNEMGVRNEYFNYESLVVSKDKESRSRPMQARVRQHKIEFDHEAKWWNKFLLEFIQFPKSAFLDQVDACSIIFQGIAYVANAPTAEEYEEEEYEDEWDETMEDEQGKCATTGY